MHDGRTLDTADGSEKDQIVIRIAPTDDELVADELLEMIRTFAEERPSVGLRRWRRAGGGQSGDGGDGPWPSRCGRC